jgi:hypothetical protein
MILEFRIWHGAAKFTHRFEFTKLYRYWYLRLGRFAVTVR